MTIALSKDVEAFVEEQVRAGVSPDASTFVNEVLRSLSKHRQLSFSATLELEAWLLQTADTPVSPLTAADFDDIRQRVSAQLNGPAA